MVYFPTLKRTGLAVIALLLSMAPWGQAQASDDSGNVKAVIIFNILRFASFPHAGRALKLCTRSNEVIARNLQALDGRSLGERRLDVVLVPSWSAGTSACDVIYTGSGDAKALPKARYGQITIGDGPSFIDRDGTVGLIDFGGQTRFTINARIARRADVRFSSQLMRLAARVIN
ncbi:MAG: YfiR family protein [Novosphingobium sp.]